MFMPIFIFKGDGGGGKNPILGTKFFALIKWHLEPTLEADFLCVNPKISLIYGNDSAQVIRLNLRAQARALPRKPCFFFAFSPQINTRRG